MCLCCRCRCVALFDYVLHYSSIYKLVSLLCDATAANWFGCNEKEKKTDPTRIAKRLLSIWYQKCVHKRTKLTKEDRNKKRVEKSTLKKSTRIKWHQYNHNCSHTTGGLQCTGIFHEFSELCASVFTDSCHKLTHSLIQRQLLFDCCEHLHRNGM